MQANIPIDARAVIVALHNNGVNISQIATETLSHCQRRITNGQSLMKDRGYVVYLVKAPLSGLQYDSWLCGGAIVSSEFVITSAACVHDVEFLYVIAGYKKYVPDNEIETDRCTSTMKKRVIYTCSPKGYVMRYGELDYWADIDIALVKVESPFNFDDPKYETLCSYKPTTIPINYDEKYQEASNDALVFGWGHAEIWRRPGDTYNYNQQKLKYASVMLLDKNKCVERFRDYANMSKVITRYMICSLAKGNIDEEGKTIQHSTSLRLLSACTKLIDKILGFEGESCENREGEESSGYDDTRRSGKRSNHTNNFNLTEFNHTKNVNLTEFNHTKNVNLTEFNHTNKVNLSEFNNKQARRNGFCQNDHGGPLITWAGTSEVLIGVASVFKVSEKYECTGPFLYTSTVCTGLFLNCILGSDFPDKNGRRYLCDRPASERGYDTIERTISWKDHPAGSAENENIGRAGPEPILSAGLKYLTKNNQPLNAGNKNNDSSNTFQAHKIPPIVSNAPKKRFSVQERGQISVNDRHQEESELNKMYLTNNSPVPVNNKPIDRLKIKERISERKNISEKQSLLTNDRFAEKSTFLVNGGSSEKPTFSFNERQQGNENQRLPVIGRYPVSKGPPKYFQEIPPSMAVRSVRPIRN